MERSLKGVSCPVGLESNSFNCNWTVGRFVLKKEVIFFNEGYGKILVVFSSFTLKQVPGDIHGLLAPWAIISWGCSSYL